MNISKGLLRKMPNKLLIKPYMNSFDRKYYRIINEQ